MSRSTIKKTCGYCRKGNAADLAECVRCRAPFTLAPAETPLDLPAPRRATLNLPDGSRSDKWRKVNVFLCVPCGKLRAPLKRYCADCARPTLFAVVFVEPLVTTTLPESIPIMEEPTFRPAMRDRWRAAMGAFVATLRR
jgi:predicted amidophosphoribosyltransferase